MSTGGGHKGKGKGISPGGSPSPFDPSLPLDKEGHERFVQELVNRRSQARAYLLAYPDCKPTSAGAASTRLLREDKVKARLDFLKQEFRERFRMSQEDIILGLEMAAQFDPDLLYKADGSMLPVSELPAEIRLCIEKIEADDIRVDGKVIGRTNKIQAMSKTRVYELLTKIHGMQREKKEVTHRFSLEDLLAGEEKEASK